MPVRPGENGARSALKLVFFVSFCAGVILGGVVALPVLAEHFFGTHRQPEFVIDLLIFGGVCAVLAAILLSNRFGYTEWLKEWAAPAESEQAVAPTVTENDWSRQVSSEARIARGTAQLPETATASGEQRRSSFE